MKVLHVLRDTLKYLEILTTQWRVLGTPSTFLSYCYLNLHVQERLIGTGYWLLSYYGVVWLLSIGTNPV